MRIPAIRLLAVVCGLWLAAAMPAQTGQTYGPGTAIDSLTVGNTTYRQVKVRSVNARTLVIMHAGGMASLRLRDLPPEWRERFKYDPAAEEAADQAAAAARAAQAAAPKPKPKATTPTAKAGANKFALLLQKFGEPAPVQAEVDLRPRFFEMELSVKNQGLRPSCAVFAVVSALEFQNAEQTGQVEKYSEEYLIWASRKSVQRVGEAAPKPAPANPDETGFRDEGFTLTEVVSALRAYGVPLQSKMPYVHGSSERDIPEPPAEVIREARGQQQVSVQPVPGRDRPTLINNVVHVLNSGVPVPVGLAWPEGRVNGYLDKLPASPTNGHAVTLVGYKSPTGQLTDAYFIFKNSWGPRWGQGGYGTVTYRYLTENLYEAVLLELRSK